MIRARIDPVRCAGEQVCAEVSEGLFELGPKGISRAVRDFEEKDLPMLREAELFCPMGAILIDADAER